MQQQMSDDALAGDQVGYRGNSGPVPGADTRLLFKLVWELRLSSLSSATELDRGGVCEHGIIDETPNLANYRSPKSRRRKMPILTSLASAGTPVSCLFQRLCRLN
jgi:hypothetical protein